MEGANDIAAAAAAGTIIRPVQVLLMYIRSTTQNVLCMHDMHEHRVAKPSYLWSLACKRHLCTPLHTAEVLQAGAVNGTAW